MSTGEGVLQKFNLKCPVGFLVLSATVVFMSVWFPAGFLPVWSDTCSEGMVPDTLQCHIEVGVERAMWGACRDQASWRVRRGLVFWEWTASWRRKGHGRSCLTRCRSSVDKCESFFWVFCRFICAYFSLANYLSHTQTQPTALPFQDKK